MTYDREAERARLDAANAARTDGPPPHPIALFSGKLFSPAPRQSHPLATMTGEAALGLPRPPITSTRARPSDYDDED
jgi:hypothetical protein